jgi:uncharacterized damage-inducible protein DinB
MNLTKILKHELESSREFFERSTRVLREEDSGYAPTPEQYTVAAQVAHAALTIDWFLEGAFGTGFDMNFAEHDRKAREVKSLGQARQMLAEAYARVIQATEDHSDVAWMVNLPENGIMQGPKSSIVFGIVEHSAHHRGALSVYARLLGLQPLMPYMEM